MPYHGSPRCNGCGGEDCCCCEVWLEEQASQRYEQMYGPEDNEDMDDFDDYDEDDDDEDFDDCDESMDGDFDSGMSSAGHGMDEDYNGWNE